MRPRYRGGRYTISSGYWMVSRLRQAWLMTTPMPTRVDHTVRPMRGTSDWPRRARWPVTTTSVVSGGWVSAGSAGR